MHPDISARLHLDVVLGSFKDQAGLNGRTLGECLVNNVFERKYLSDVSSQLKQSIPLQQVRAEEGKTQNEEKEEDEAKDNYSTQQLASLSSTRTSYDDATRQAAQSVSSNRGQGGSLQRDDWGSAL